LTGVKAMAFGLSDKRGMTEWQALTDAVSDVELTDLLGRQLRDDHDAQLALCVELERLADMLPSLPPPRRVRRICRHIEFVTTRYFRRAETIFADALTTRPDPALRQMLASLSSMHALDAVHGEDVVAALWDGTARGRAVRPDELGYMLRCFFDGCRRAVALEEALMLLIGPAAGARLGSVEASA